MDASGSRAENSITGFQTKISRNDDPTSIGDLLPKTQVAKSSPKKPVCQQESPWRRDAPRGVETDLEMLPETFLPKCREAFREQRFPLYLFGLPGRGKTCAAACLYRMVNASSVWWWNASEFINKVTTCRREGSVDMGGQIGGTSEAGLWRIYVDQMDWLFIDDIGVRTPTDAQYDIVFRLVDSRQGKPTVYTGNLNPKELEATFDGRISSRLLRGTCINFASQIDKRTLNRKGVKI